MPTHTTSERVRCRDCDCRRLSSEMSMFNTLCNDCYDTHYVHCVRCARLLSRWSGRRRCQHQIGPELYSTEGEYYCYNCYYECTREPSMWQPTPIDVSIATYQRIGSKRKYGIEIETATCENSYKLNGQTHFGCKNDCTISGQEFDSPILYGDEGLGHIEFFLAEAARRKWTVDERCGCHTHYDMRNETKEQLFHTAFAYSLTWPMWRRTVPSRRRNTSYSHMPRYTARDVERFSAMRRGFEGFANNQDRYDYVNLTAYCDHSTFEVRLLEGTLNPLDICNWITLHCRFIDCVRDLSYPELRDQFDRPANMQFRALTTLIKDAALIDWLACRARTIGNRPLRGPGCLRP